MVPISESTSLPVAQNDSCNRRCDCRRVLTIYRGSVIWYEGPTFCCRKGKVKVFIPEVPQEMQQLFTSQVDKDERTLDNTLDISTPTSP